MTNKKNNIVAVLTAALLLSACAHMEPVEATVQETTVSTTESTTAPVTTQPSKNVPVILETNGWVYTAAGIPEDVAQSAVENLAELEGIDSVKVQFASTFPEMAKLYIEKLLNGTYENKENYTKAYLQTHMQVVAVRYTLFCEDENVPRGGNYQCNFALLLDEKTGLWSIWGEQTPAPDKVPRTSWHCEPAETPEAAAQGAIESLKDAYSILDVEVQSVEYNSELTAANIKQLAGSDLVKDMALTDAQLETHFKIINVTYELTVDKEIPDRRLGNGVFECQFDMVLDDETGLWSCFSSMTNTLEDHELPE